MIRYPGFAGLAMGIGLSLACEQGSDIEAETKDLAEAQKNAPEVAKDLEARLQEAKAEVVELEKKLALAREGVTDEVMEERGELERALQTQRGEVQKDVNEARREAEILNKSSDQALEQLQKTQPPAQVDARLKTETDVVRGAQQQGESPPRNELIPVRGGPEQEPTGEAEVESTTSTTPSAPTQPRDPSQPAPPAQPAAPTEPVPPTPPAAPEGAER